VAKRYTESTKWNGWFRKLKPCSKLLWIYILDNCDLSGVWRVDKEMAEFSIGCAVKWDEAAENFKDQIYEFDDGEKWYIIDFVKFQNGERLTNSPIHRKIFEMMSSYGLVEKFLDENLRLVNRLQNRVRSTPIVIVEEIVEVKVEGIVEVEGQTSIEKVDESKPDIEQVFYPYDTQLFREAWAGFLQHRKELKKPFKSKRSEQAALKQLAEFNEEFSLKLISNSIAGGYQGIVYPNTHEEYLKYQKSNAGQQQFSGISKKQQLIADSISKARGYNTGR
jgi:hypothetical protein